MSHHGEHGDKVFMTVSSTMEKSMSESRTRENAVQEQPFPTLVVLGDGDGHGDDSGSDAGEGDDGEGMMARTTMAPSLSLRRSRRFW